MSKLYSKHFGKWEEKIPKSDRVTDLNKTQLISLNSSLSCFHQFMTSFDLCRFCTRMQEVLRMIFGGQAWNNYEILLWLNPYTY